MSTSPAGPYKPITYGRDHNYYKEVTVASSTFGGDDGYTAADGYDCNAFIWFKPQTIMLYLKSPDAAVLEYSFNGNTLHGELSAATGSLTRLLTFNNRVESKIWFRVKSGGPVTVQVQAWAQS